MNMDFTVKLNDRNSLQTHGQIGEDWTVTVADTGPTTMTGGRLHAIKHYVFNETFIGPFGDGVRD